jgi:hypothetical protein
MKKILAEIKAQFESVKGQPTLEEVIANDLEWQEFCKNLRQEAAADKNARELQESQQPSGSNDQQKVDKGELDE